jgi:hypothetical protein
MKQKLRNDSEGISHVQSPIITTWVHGNDQLWISYYGMVKPLPIMLGKALARSCTQQKNNTIP